MNKIKNVVVMAGGDSTRFWPLTNKFLTNFTGQSYLRYYFDEIAALSENVIVVGNEQDLKEIKSNLPEKARLIIQKKDYEGMAGAVLSCKDVIKGDCLILGNDLFNFGVLKELIDKGLREKSDLIFLAQKVNSYFPGGYLKLTEGRVTGIVEKPLPGSEPSDLVNLVVDYFSDVQKFISILEQIQPDNDDHYEQGLQQLMDKGKVGYLSYQDYWLPLKYPWHVLPMMRFFLSKISGRTIEASMTIAKNAIISGSVNIGKNVKIGDYVKITGPCYIGDNTVIADYALIRESQIGENCLIGSSCEVARSYLDNNVSLHRNYIGDSVLSPSVEFGAGAVTGNYRFDAQNPRSLVQEKQINCGQNKLGAIVGKSTKIGVNATLLPGVKIGSHCLVGPGQIVKDDLADRVYYFRDKKVPNKL